MPNRKAFMDEFSGERAIISVRLPSSFSEAPVRPIGKLRLELAMFRLTLR
jgi:hypothetical protein